MKVILFKPITGERMPFPYGVTTKVKILCSTLHLRASGKKEVQKVLLYMSFNESGNLICREDDSGILQPPKLVLAVGEPNPADENKALRFNDPNSIAGILMRRFGGFAVLDVNDFTRP